MHKTDAREKEVPAKKSPGVGQGGKGSHESGQDHAEARASHKARELQEQADQAWQSPRR